MLDLLALDIPNSAGVASILEINIFVDKILSEAKEFNQLENPTEEDIKAFDLKIKQAQLHIKYTQEKVASINYILKQAIPAFTKEGLERLTNSQKDELGEIPPDY